MADKLTQYRIKDTVTGKTFTIEGPEGASDEDLNSFIESNPYDDTTPEPPSPYLEGAEQPNAPVEDIPQPQGRVTMQNEAVTPAARQGVDTYISNSSGKGADPRWMTPDQESQYIAMLNDPSKTYEDIQAATGEWARAAGVPAMGMAGGPKALADYRAPLRPGERRSNTVTYKDFTEDLPKADPTVSDVDTNPMTGTQGKLISLAQRGFQDAAQYGVAGWAARTYHDWMNTGMEALQQKFPGLTPEEYEDIQTQAVAYVQRTAREANAEVTKDDPMIPWLVGQFAGSAGFEDFLPMIKGEKLIARLAGAAGVNAASDAGWQGVDIADNVQEKFDPLQTVAAAGIGAGLHGAVEGAAALGHKIASTKRIEAARVSPVTYDGDGPVSALIAAPVKNGRTKAAREAHRDYNFSVGEAAATHINNTVADWKNAPEFEVHPNFEAIDGIDKNAVAAIDSDGRVKVNMKAVLRDAKRANVSPEDVLTAMTYHEALGHHGLASLFGTRLDTMMRSFYDNGTEEFKTQVNDWMEANPKSKLGQSDWIALATEEVLAEHSEAGKLSPALADRVKNMVKGFGRKMGVDLSYSPREIKTILGMAHDATVNGKKGDVQGNGFKYMYAGAGARNRPDFKGTEWFRGPDGGWRWEIDDSKSKIDDELMSDMLTDEWKEMYKNNDDVIISDVLDHPELFKNYPQLGNIKFTRQPGFFDIWQSMQGWYDSKTNTINITPYAKEDPRAIILHELQHAIQNAEGFAIGGNKKTAVRKMSDEKVIEVGERYHDWYKKEVEKKLLETNAILEFAESPLATEWVEASTASNAAYAALKDIPIAEFDHPLNKEWSRLRKELDKVRDKVLETYGFDMKTVLADKKLWNQWYSLDSIFSHTPPDKIGEKLDALHDDAVKANAKLEVLEESLDDRDVKTLRLILQSDDNVSFQAYEHLFGEVEARDVEKRMNLSKEERMFVEPYTLEKTNEPNDFIFDFGDDEASSLSFSDKNDDGKVVNLDDKREEKKLKKFSADLRYEVSQRAQAAAQEGRAIHDAGGLPLNVGDRILTTKAKENGDSPWKVVGYYVDPKNPEKFGYHVERGKEGTEDHERNVLLVSDKKADEAMRKYRPEWDRAKHVAEWTIMTGPKPKYMSEFKGEKKGFDESLRVRLTGEKAKTFLNELGVFNGGELYKMTASEAIAKAERLNIDHDWVDYYEDSFWDPKTKETTHLTPQPDMNKYLPKTKLMRSFRDPTKPRLGNAKFDLADDHRVTSEELVDIGSARKIIDGVLDEYVPQGTETFDEQKRAGKALGLTSKQINNASKKGVNELSKRIFAAAQIAEKTNNTLADLSEKIGSAYVKDAKQYASLKDRYIRANLEYNALMGTLFDMGSEAGRALGAIRAIDYTYKKFGALSETLKDFDQHNILSGFADDETFLKYVQTIAAMQQQGNVKGLTVLQRSIVKPYWWQYMLSFRHSMMLSGLGTHAKNAVDNTLMVIRELEEQGLAMAAFPIRKGLRAVGMKNVDEGVSPQEAAGRLYGILSALVDSETYRVTAKSYIEGTDGKTISTKTEMSDAHIPLIGKISTDALHASDVFFRAINDSANLYTLGVRSARKDGYTGMAAFTEGSSRAHSPTLEMIKEAKKMTNVTLLVDAPSLLGTLVEGGKAIRPNMNAGQQAGAFFANFMLPFFRVSDRLLFQKLRRSPLAFLDRVTLEDLKAGGSRRDIAISRMVIGTYLIGQYWAAAGDKKVEGEADMPYAKQEALEGAGYMPNSVVSDEQMTDASALNLSLFPSDLQNAMAANVASIRKAWDAGQADEGSTIDALGTAAIALGSIIASSSFAENLSTYIDPFIEKDSASKGRAGANLAANVAGQFLPAAGRQIRNEIDENVRNTTGDGGFRDRVKGRLQNAIPGLSDELPQKYDVYGDEMKNGKSLLGMDNAIPRDQDAVGKELGRLERTTEKTVVSGAPKSISITSIVSDDFTADTKYGKVKEGKIKLSGAGKEEWKKIQGKALRKIMSAVMDSQGWETADDKTKIAIVKEAREAAYDATKTEMFPLLGIPTEDEE